MAATQDNRLLKINTPLGKDHLLLNRIVAEESISGLYSIEVEFLHEATTPGFDPTDVDEKALLGNGAAVAITQRDGTHRFFHGIINQFVQGERNTRFSFYYATIVTHVWILTQRRQSRIFQEKSVPDILKEVLTGIACKYEIQGDLKPRDPAMDSFPGTERYDRPDNSSSNALESFFVNLSLYPYGAVAGDGAGTPLIKIEWSSDQFAALRDLVSKFPFGGPEDLNPQRYPLQFSEGKNLGEMFGVPHWANAEKLVLNAETAAEVKDFIQTVRYWIEDGEADEIMNHSRDKFDEVSYVYEISEEERAEMFRQLLAENCEKDEWLFETLEDDEFSLRLCCDDRSVECVGIDWRPLIRGIESEAGRFFFRC